MKKRRMANSVRKFIRKEKARIRRDVLDVGQQREQIAKLYPNAPIKPKTETKDSQDKKIKPNLK
ncbi:MAG: hypothetical protein Q8N58_00325 [bacterium]|nr:hypothetical protein [bacterium]